MKAIELKSNILSKEILKAFVSGEINTHNDVDSVMSQIQKILGLTRTESAQFFRNSIGA